MMNVRRNASQHRSLSASFSVGAHKEDAFSDFRKVLKSDSWMGIQESHLRTSNLMELLASAPKNP